MPITQPQDTAMAYVYKLWPWVEANKNRLIGGGAIAIIAGFVISFYFWRQNQNEIAAGQALTELAVSNRQNSDAGQFADACLKIAADFPGTRAGERAAVQGATALFDSGKYTEAQAQFQQFLKIHPDSVFSPQATLGVAACLDVQGKTDLAASAYRRVISGFQDSDTVNAAKFAVAQIDERQGKLSDAENLYEDVARSNPNGSLGSEAALHAMELQAKLTPAPASTAPLSSLNLNTKP